MSEPRTMSSVFRALMPEGAVWSPAQDGDLDKLIEAIGDDIEEVRLDLEALATMRDPATTPSISDLEIELGVVPDEGLDEATRRAHLAAVKGQTPGTGSASCLEASLRAAGFDVYVWNNCPALDPAAVIGATFEQCDDAVPPTTQCDSSGATMCGFGGGELIVNGDDQAFAAYVVPENPARWPFVFWIGGSATGWEHFDDWKMEWATTSAWTDGGDAILSKTLTRKNSGIRSLLVQAGPTVDVTEQQIQVDQVADLRSFYRADAFGSTVYNLAEFSALVEDEEDFE